MINSYVIQNACMPSMNAVSSLKAKKIPLTISKAAQRFCLKKSVEVGCSTAPHYRIENYF